MVRDFELTCYRKNVGHGSVTLASADKATQQPSSPADSSPITPDSQVESSFSRPLRSSPAELARLWDTQTCLGSEIESDRSGFVFKSYSNEIFSLGSQS